MKIFYSKEYYFYLEETFNKYLNIMKKNKLFILITALLFCVNISNKAQTSIEEYSETLSSEIQTYGIPTVFLDAIAYDVTTPELIYQKTFSLSYHEYIDFNIPFASHFEIDHSTVSFSINQEEFMRRVYNVHKNDGFWDIQMGIYYKATMGPSFDEMMPVLSRIGIIRIIFK